MATPLISVIVPTYQRAALLRSCIRSFDTQDDPPPFEVIVIDDGSTDSTPNVLADLEAERPWLRWSRQPANRGPAAARNRAVMQAEGELVLFIDDDIVASTTLLRWHATLHGRARDDRLAVLGRVDWHPSLTVTAFMRWLDRSGLQFAYDTWLQEGPVPIPASAFYTANLSMSRRLVVDVGGFDERFPFPAYEDLELATRLTARGLHLDYRPNALAYHFRAIDLPTFIRRMAHVGESAQLMRTISPDFPIDDRALINHQLGGGARALTTLKAALVRSEQNRGKFYWAAVAAAYERGLRGAGGTALNAGNDTDG
jgi:glycosyltransferase involved in cell wall biosynthesis